MKPWSFYISLDIKNKVTVTCHGDLRGETFCLCNIEGQKEGEEKWNHEESQDSVICYKGDFTVLFILYRRLDPCHAIII